MPVAIVVLVLARRMADRCHRRHESCRVIPGHIAVCLTRQNNLKESQILRSERRLTNHRFVFIAAHAMEITEGLLLPDMNLFGRQQSLAVL
jgi:hypothetical protein